jgi:hypothetical protein
MAEAEGDRAVVLECLRRAAKGLWWQQALQESAPNLPAGDGFSADNRELSNL